MTIDRINKYLDDCMRFNFIDLFYIYCQIHDIDDPESDLTEEEYTKMEKECMDTITYQFLSRLVDSMTETCNEHIYWKLEGECNK